MTTAQLCLMDVIILAGGRGTRLADAVHDVPKPLAPIAGRPFLELLIERTKSSGIAGTFVLSIGYKASQIRDWGERRSKISRDKIVCVEEDEPLGTGGALRLALVSAVKTDVAVVMNGDSFVDLDFAAMALSHKKSGCFLTIAVTEAADVSRFGQIFMAGERIVAFSEKGERHHAGYINAGVYMIDKKALPVFPHGSCSFERDVIPRFLDRGINAHVVSGAFHDIGTPASYAIAVQVLGGGSP